MNIVEAKEKYALNGPRHTMEEVKLLLDKVGAGNDDIESFAGTLFTSIKDPEELLIRFVFVAYSSSYRKYIFIAIYKVPYEDIPLMIGGFDNYEPADMPRILKWRLEIGK